MVARLPTLSSSGLHEQGHSQRGITVQIALAVASRYGAPKPPTMLRSIESHGHLTFGTRLELTHLLDAGEQLTTVDKSQTRVLCLGQSLRREIRKRHEDASATSEAVAQQRSREASNVVDPH
jgi:hypothetical protein